MSNKNDRFGKTNNQTMKTLFLIHATVITTAFSAAAFSQDIVEAAPAEGAATTIYRQVMPDGRIVYSDKTVKGGKLDHTIKVEPPIKGNSWATEASPQPVAPLPVENTPIRKVASVPGIGKKRSIDDATADVIRAEMLLEDARKRQEAGMEPLPGERTGNASGGSRLNEAYEARQKALAKDVAAAEETLRRSIAERDSLR